MLYYFTKQGAPLTTLEHLSTVAGTVLVICYNHPKPRYSPKLFLQILTIIVTNSVISRSSTRSCFHLCLRPCLWTRSRDAYNPDPARLLYDQLTLYITRLFTRGPARSHQIDARPIRVCDERNARFKWQTQQRSKKISLQKLKLLYQPLGTWVECVRSTTKPNFLC